MKVLLVISGWVLLSSAMAGNQQPMSFRIDATESRVWFDADARLFSFRGQTQKVTGRFALLSTSPLRIADARVTIDAASLDTGNTDRDRDLRHDFLEVATFPTIEFSITDLLTPRAVSGGTGWDLVVQGSLAVHGVRRDIKVPATVHLAADVITARGQIRLDMRDYNIRVPRLLWVPMKSEVLVGFQVVARPET